MHLYVYKQIIYMGVVLTTHQPLLVPGSGMGRAVPLLPVCASLSCNGTPFSIYI